MKKFSIKKTLSISVISLLLVQIIYISVIEPSFASAATDSKNVVVTLNVDPGISLTQPGPVTMAPNIGIASNGSIGSSTWTVKSNNTLGYTLSVKASASPAMVSGGNSFADYSEVTGGTPETWTVAGGNKEFGYSAYSANGTDVSTTTWGSAANCGTATGGNLVTSMKYVGFKTTDKAIASSNVPVAYAGQAITVCYAAQQNGVFAPSGSYTATITATASTI